MKNLRQDADIPDFDTVINNYDENVNIKCSSGFFLEVARPAILSLSKQTCDTSKLIIKNVKISCTNSRISLDNHNLQVNSTLFFNLHDCITEVLLGKVTVHIHVTTKVVQIQGSKHISGSKAAVWFLDNLVRETFVRESSERRANIAKINDNIKLASDDLACTLCERKYKTVTGLQKHMQSKHEAFSNDTNNPTQPLQSENRKRRMSNNPDIDYIPPAKTLGLGQSLPISTPSVLPAGPTQSPRALLSYDVCQIPQPCPSPPPPLQSALTPISSSPPLIPAVPLPLYTSTVGLNSMGNLLVPLPTAAAGCVSTTIMAKTSSATTVASTSSASLVSSSTI